MSEHYLKTMPVFDTTMLTVGDAYTIYRHKDMYYPNGEHTKEIEKFNGLLVKVDTDCLLFMILNRTSEHPDVDGFLMRIDEVLNGKFHFVHLTEEKKVDEIMVGVIPAKFDPRSLFKGRSYHIIEQAKAEYVGILEDILEDKLVFKTTDLDLESMEIKIDITSVANQETVIRLLPYDQFLPR